MSQMPVDPGPGWLTAYGYRTIVADPPWPMQSAGKLRGREGWVDCPPTAPHRPMPYLTMTIADIAALPVSELASAEGCHLYLWTTNTFLDDAFDVLRAWGFTYSTTLVWAKNLMGGGFGGAFGISTEYCLYGRRGKLRYQNRMRGTWFNWKRPYDERGKPMHSAKPPEFYAMAEQASWGPRLELFARRARDGWDAWGDQAPGAVELAALDGPAA